MKITITPMGDVVIDTDDVEAVISLVNTLRNGATNEVTLPTGLTLAETAEEFQQRKALWEAANPQIVAVTRLDRQHRAYTAAKPTWEEAQGPILWENPIAKPKRKRKPKRNPLLSAQLGDTLNWLINRNDPDGSRPTQLAAVFDITPALASYRLRKLVTLGEVERIGRGRYQAKSS